MAKPVLAAARRTKLDNEVVVTVSGLARRAASEKFYTLSANSEAD